MVKEVIKFSYGDQEPENIAEIAFELLPLASNYGLPGLKSMCVRSMKQVLSVKNVVDALFLARLYDCPDLIKYCLPIIKANVTRLKPSCAAKLKSDPDLLMGILADSSA